MARPGDTDGYLVVGRIGAPHGVRGEVRFKVMTDFPERLVPGKRVFVGEAHEAMTIDGIRGGREKAILALSGVSDRDAAGFLRQQFVYVHVSEIPDLPEGELYSHELIGLEVRTEDGARIGRIREVLHTGANDVLVVADESGGEKLLPAIDDVVLSIDPEAGTVEVRLLPGL